MTSIMLAIIGLTSVFFFGVISEMGYANFPYDGCSTDEIDVLCLYYTKNYEDWQRTCQEFWKHLLSFPHNKTVPRVMFAAVYDWFSVDNPNVNVSSWHLHESLDHEPYGSEHEEQLQEYINLNETIEFKVKFVQRLFSEMAGIREKATHFAVVFIDGEVLSFEESSSVPFILQQKDTSMNIFVVVMALTGDIVHLRDTLVVNVNLPSPYKHILALAMCDQCLQGWWRFEHKAGAYSLSCYKIITSGKGSKYHDSKNVCWDKENTDLVSIESRDELTFLQNTLYSHFDGIRQRKKTGYFSATFFLSLKKEALTIARRFSWNLFQDRIKLPLTHWMNGKPTAGKDQVCVVWQFDWIEEINDSSNVSRQTGHFVDGWVDVDCHLKSYFIVCEVPFYSIIEDNPQVTISPATDERLSRALNSGGFVTFQNNIVSVSVNTDQVDFLQFLQETGYETFPLFDCGPDAGSPRYISYSKVCDQVDDCSNIRDEDVCYAKRIEGCRPGYQFCKGILCCDGYCLPQRWVNDGEIDCPVCNNSTGIVLNDESEYLLKNEDKNKTCAIYCYQDKCIDISQLNDGHIDCTGSYALLDETIGKLERAETCRNQKGQSKWAPKCVYVKDEYEAVLGCRDMSHLENCADFVCPLGYVKCPSRYCIPQHYVLNGANDCPSGEDEQQYHIGPCTGNFACWNSKICLYPDLVCDGHPDCPHKDDEVDCNLNFCAAGFRCVSGTITVSTYNKLVPLTSLPVKMGIIWSMGKYLDMSGVDISAVFSQTMDFPIHLNVLKFSECKIRFLGYWQDTHFYCVQDMDLSYNLLTILDIRDSLSLTARCLRSLNISFNSELTTLKNLILDRLETLDLSHTGLSYLHDNSFNGLPDLKHLYLSFTSIGHLYKRIFSSRLNLQTLDLRGSHSDIFYENIFNGLSISQDLYTDSFEICCPQIRGNRIPAHTCHAPVDAISSCFDLLGVDVQRVLLWVVAVLAVLGNMAVIVYRLIWDRSVLKTGYGLFVTNLGISDFIMGVYLFIIAGADYYYRGIYVLYDRTWRESLTCKIASFLAIVSSETSIFCVFFITLDRFLVMKFPFGQVRLSKMNINIAVCLCWLIGFLLAQAPVVFKFEIFTSNAMCVSLPLTTKRLNGWEFSFGVFIAFNFLLCVVIAVGQRAIFRAMSENRITGAATSTSPRRAADIMVAKQLSMVALSNFLCWFPVGFMGLLSLTGHEISNDVYAWTTIIVLPINSAANPLLYTIPVLMDRWNNFKVGHLRPK